MREKGFGNLEAYAPSNCQTLALVGEKIPLPSVQKLAERECELTRQKHTVEKETHDAHNFLESVPGATGWWVLLQDISKTSLKAYLWENMHSHCD